jgi:DNA-directed RNA polymerase subunit beta'
MPPFAPTDADRQSKLVRIRLATAADIEDWSSGEVTRPDSIDYRNLRPVDGGLFCERIFGPLKNWECGCGKYRGIKYEGRVCDRCRVIVGRSRLRRQRMGHIVLHAPVVHLWFFRTRPSRLALLLGVKAKDLEKAIYYHGYLVIEPGDSPYSRGRLLSDSEAKTTAKAFGASGFQAETGSAAIEKMLAAIDLRTLAVELRRELKERQAGTKSGGARMRKAAERLQLVESLRKSGNDPSSIVLRRLPVMPADLRPLVPLPSGGFASSDVNELYRRVISRNNRLARLIELESPRVILHSEMRLLQQAVDALFDNRRSARPVLASSGRPLRSLADLVEGKDGRFRESLLGKRVDYSARSVIVVGPELSLHECGLPKRIALTLYQPFLLRRLMELGLAASFKAAKALIAARDERIWPLLEEIMAGHPVLLNRAPTLHRMNIQAFIPQLVEGNAIRLHPLACKGFNADFDGDQMAVHLPLSIEAQVEARSLLFAPNNLFSPASGQPVVGLSQDIVLGCHYATLAPRGGCAGGMSTAKTRSLETPATVMTAYEQGRFRLHDAVTVRLPFGRQALAAGERRGDEPIEVPHAEARRIETTVGRVLFDEMMPPGMPFYNLTQNDRSLARIVADCRRLAGQAATVALLDRIKAFGFRMASASGLSCAASDLRTPVSKAAVIARAQAADSAIRQAYSMGRMTADERSSALVEIWTKASQQVAEHTLEQLEASHAAGEPLNGLHLMHRSGARGGFEQVRQLAGMRGLMARPNGQILETPIKANFREGLSVLEYFQSTHGARKGLADTALRTAQAGHLTRRLADAAQNVVVTMEDCGTAAGVWATGARRPLAKEIAGRASTRALYGGKRLLAKAGELLSPSTSANVEAMGVERALVRSPLTCQARRGICQQCYGADLSTGRLVELGAAVGVIAAQSIGEPGVQLTMRTFHQGGAIGEGRDITQGLPRVIELFEARRLRVADGEEDGQRDGVSRALAILAEAQEVYARQGAEVHDKHFEVILACMLRNVRVESPGDTSLVPGELIDKQSFAEANAALGDEGEPATGRVELLGVTKAALASKSFLSAASFQETASVLVDAALAGKVDRLEGLKENVIVGEAPPCGTGYYAPRTIVARRASEGESPDAPKRPRSRVGLV